MKRVIDADGRLFGKVNLVDAAIGAFVVVLVPLAYGAVLLFRPPAPRITSVDPAPVSFTEDRAALGSELAGKVKVRGEGLRPVLRAEVGGQPALAYIFEDPATADVLYSTLPPGRHDLVLYDGVQEVARAAGAVVIPEKPSVGLSRVRVIGRFLDLTDETARSLQVGAKYPNATQPEVEVVALGEVEPAQHLVNGASEVGVTGRFERMGVLSLPCQIPPAQPQECHSLGIAVTPTQIATMPGAPAVRLRIEQVMPDVAPQPGTVRVRFLGYPSVIDLLKPGARDRPQWSVDGRGAIIASLEGRRAVTGQVTVGLSQEGFAPTAEVQAIDQVAAVDAVLNVGLDTSRTGWRYRGELLRVGGPFTFTTSTYIVRGVVLGIATRPAPVDSGSRE